MDCSSISCLRCTSTAVYINTMHSSVIVLFALVALSTAMPQFQQQRTFHQGPASGYQHIQDDFGQHSVAFSTPNGGSHSEQGALEQGPEGLIPNIKGSYSFYSPEGQLYTVRYVSDQTGFHPSGDHLPVAPSPII